MIEAALFGTVGRDPEPKTSANGKRYMKISVRVGNDDAAQWVLVTVLGDVVDELVGRAVKGSRLYVEGRLTLDEWTAQDGAKRHGLSVTAWRCELPGIGRNKPKRERPTTDRPKVPASRQPQDRLTADPGFHDDEIPF